MRVTHQRFFLTIDEQVEKTAGCAGYEAFKRDVDALKSINDGAGLPAITANIWIQKICQLSDEELCAYVERYRPGMLDARYEHYPFVGKPMLEQKRRRTGKLVASGIEWDTDDDEDVQLPTEIEIPDGMVDEEEISDYISDMTGFCHRGYVLTKRDEEETGWS